MKIHFDKTDKPTREHNVMFEMECLNVLMDTCYTLKQIWFQCDKFWNKIKIISTQNLSFIVIFSGTTITAVNLFKNLPVRRQFYNTNKKKKDELKRIEDLLLSYGIVSPSVRISLRHNKDIVWQKNQVPDLKTAILETLGKDVSSNLQRKELSLEIPKVLWYFFSSIAACTPCMYSEIYPVCIL